MTDDLFDEAFADALVPTTVKQDPLAKPPRSELESDALKEIENKLLKENLKIIESVPGWTELDPKNPHLMPDGWIEEMGEKEATRKHRIAQAAHLSGSKSPVGLKMAHETVMGIVKNKGSSGPTRQLNIQVVQLPIENRTANYEVIDVDD